MYDNRLISLVLGILNNQRATAGLPGDIVFKQAFQPTQQGINTAPAAYMFKIGDRRRGSPYRADVYDVARSRMVHTEIAEVETTFQITALSTQDPNDVDQMTASDIANQIAYILQSTATLMALQESGVGIYNITQIRNPYFTDDRDRHAASPNFDFTLTHKQIVVSSMPVLQSVELKILIV